MATLATEYRPAKRARSTTCSDSPTLGPDAELWFEDGNIVLVVGDIAFRVYKGLLWAQSPVFNDMFSASKLQADEQYDGVPVVRLFDSPEDLRHLLRVLLPKIQAGAMKQAYDVKTEFHVISALIRLAHKYQTEDIEKQAVAALCGTYSSELDVWMSFDATCTSDDRTFATGAVNLARLTSTPSIHPSALYHCAVLGARVLRGFTREDGTVDYLCQDDLARCISAIEPLCAESAGFVRALAASGPISASCRDPEQCLVSRSVSLSRALPKELIVVEALSVFQTLHTAARLCGGCANHQDARHVDVWARLPGIFDIQELDGQWPR